MPPFRMGIAIILGAGLILAGLLSLAAQPSQAYQDNQQLPRENSPALQAATGFIRVALSGVDKPGCGDTSNPCQSVQFAVDEALAGESILIAAGTYLGVQSRFGLTQHVFIDKPLTLSGGYTVTNWRTSDPRRNPTTLDAQRLGRVIMISDSVGVTLQNLKVTQGEIRGLGLCTDIFGNCGGGILATGPIRLENVTVLSNFADRSGGGLAALSQTVILGGNFESNVGLSNFSRGGGLYSEAALSLERVIFKNNQARSAGGAVSVEDSDVAVINSRFQNNQSFSSVGGAIYLSVDTNIGEGRLMTIDGSRFINNTASISSSAGSGNGGAIYGFNADMTVTDSLFDGNGCFDDTCDGGAISLQGNPFNHHNVLSLIGTTFSNNRAVRNGGGVYHTFHTVVDDTIFENNQTDGNNTNSFGEGGGGLYSDGAEIVGSQFINNWSGEDGGGLFINANFFTATLTIRDSLFENNRALSHGGGVRHDGFSSNLPAAVQTTNFISNYAGFNGGGWHGGFNGASAIGPTLNISDSQFVRNHADGPENDGGSHQTHNGGGGIWNAGDLFVTQTQFISNVAQTNGGGAHVRGNVVVADATFDQNKALGDFSFGSYGGGGIYAIGSLHIINTEIINNQAYFGGGAWVNGEVIGQGGFITSNYAARAGGGLQVNQHLILSGTQILSNSAETNGGGISTSSTGDASSPDTVELTDVYFQANQVISNTFSSGGALYTTDLLTVTRGRFIDNQSARNGGAIALSNPATFSGTIFHQNYSEDSGGAIQSSLSFNEVLALYDTEFMSNTAKTNGGAIQQNFGRLHLIDSQFQHNKTENGMGGAIQTFGRILVTRTHFLSNTAQTHGGGLRSGTTYLYDAVFSGNQALQGDGGGLSAFQSEIFSYDSQFAHNTAGGDGGGVHTTFRATLVDSLIAHNQAMTNGGGLRVHHQLLVTRTIFVQNQAYNGGGIYRDGRGRGRLVNSLFANNEVSNAGNALFIDFNRANHTDLIHLTIANQAPTGQAAIQVMTGTVNITNTIIASHTQAISAQAGSTVYEDYNLFFNNDNNLSGMITSGGNSIGGNPAFINPGEHDYQLGDLSRAIDKGIDLGVGHDFFMEARPQGRGVDIGYDEAFYFAALSVQKSVRPNLVLPGQRVTYTIHITNNGTGMATGIRLTDTFPVSLTNINLTGNYVVTDTGQVPSFVWEGASLAPATSVQMTMTAQLSAPLNATGNITNIIAISTTQIETAMFDNVSQATFTIAFVDLALSEGSQYTAYAGEAVTFTQKLTNAGNITQTVTLTAVSTSGYPTSIDPQQVTLAPIEATAVSIMVTTPYSVPLGNQDIVIVQATSDLQPNLAETTINTATVQVRQADLSISQTRSGLTTKLPGVPVTYTVHIMNNGPDQVDAVVTNTVSGNMIESIDIFGPFSQDCQITNLLILCQLNNL
ncbi:MAG: hypothetical protein AAF629_17450 [Chloroflexota bacterium]